MEEKITLEQYFGGSEDNNDDEKLIDLQLWECDLQILLTFFGKLERMLLAMNMSGEEEYRFKRIICLIDIAIHKKGGYKCTVGSEDCGLLNTLEAFRNKFKNEIARDTKYKLSDFEWKN